MTVTGLQEGAGKLLLAAGADPALLSCTQDTPLHLAAWKGSLRLCTLLLEAGADVNAEDGERHTPVMPAVVALESKCSTSII